MANVPEFSIKALVDEADHHIRRMREDRTQAYWERNQLVAALSKVLPAHLYRHDPDDESWDKEWMWIVCIHGPHGQMTWHIHDQELHQFDHLPKYELNIPGLGKNGALCNGWDGHSKAEKYQRLTAMPVAPWAVRDSLQRIK